MHVSHGTSAQAAYGIARVHYENKNIVLLLLIIVKFVKYFFDSIIYTINTLNEWVIFNWKHILSSSADRRKCLRLLRAAFHITLCGINCYRCIVKSQQLLFTMAAACSFEYPPPECQNSQLHTSSWQEETASLTYYRPPSWRLKKSTAAV